MTCNTSSRTDAAIVLSQPMTEPQAAAACSALGEKLWSPTQSPGDFLDYLCYEGTNGPYWIAGRQGPTCKTFTADGTQSQQKCLDHLPALCTQSAPLANATYADNSTTWQTTISAGAQTLTGFRDRFSFRFEGVRYAAEPERWTYSTVYNGTGHADALAFGSECVQGNAGSTDCLFLNVWTPFLPGGGGAAAAAEKPKPVMFWIHGGAFTGGTGSDPTFDGGSLVSRGDVVVVTTNYRLGTLGFLALDDGVTNGNYGFADQITALKWVQANIKSFGGDPDRITILGQSAGAASVRALLASPKAIGKYAAAIPQSNLAGSAYATTYSSYLSILQEVALAAEPILNATGCLNATSQLACLRAVDPFVLANVTTPARYLVVDGTYLVTDQLEVTGRGPAAHVPVLMGFMRDDGAAFITYPAPNDTVSTLLTANGFNLSTISTLSVFPEPASANETLNVFNTTALIATDSEFRCLDEATAYSAIKHAVFPTVYFYEFNRSYQLSFYQPNFPVCEPPPTPAHPYGDPSAEYFKCHSGELYYVFGSLAFNGLPPRDDYDIPMSQFTLDTWASFARTYDPTPSLAFLQARGFANTTAEIQRSGAPWLPVTTPEEVGEGDAGLMLRMLQYPSVGEGFGIYDGQTEFSERDLSTPDFDMDAALRYFDFSGKVESHLYAAPQPVPDCGDVIERIEEASARGDLPAVQETFVELQASPAWYFYAKAPGSALFIAIENQRTSIVAFLLERGVTVGPSHGKIATLKRDTGVLELLLDHGWDINAQLEWASPLPLAFAIEDPHLTAWFLSHGADPNTRCLLDLSPLSAAVQYAPLSIINSLFAHGGSINSEQLLHFAVQRDTPDALEVLTYILAKDPPINEVMYQNHWDSSAQQMAFGLGTPLHEAAEKGKSDVPPYQFTDGHCANGWS
ncbi:hypothetical protein B0A55_01301 [Friedmanniomyces simplex]|uniref:Carboxylesterase type B domain-containing protein n=1 Tax=Friedmanniomyces simplex TaxID=329884 RepID=A0A4U0Y431_9PEZI|nr:hypothetical protein B0A55_01301 [Friedmanniomyces simplex]